MGMSFQDSSVISLALSNLNNFLKLHIIFLRKSQNSYSSLSSILMLVPEAQKHQVGDANWYSHYEEQWNPSNEAQKGQMGNATMENTKEIP